MNVKDTYRQIFNLYPGHMYCPLDVSKSLFDNSNYEWVDGELVYPWEEQSYIEPHFTGEREDKYGCLKSLNIGWRLCDDAKRLKIKFVQDNIEDMLNAPVCSSYFSSEIRHDYYSVNVNEYASIFKFPQDIKPDWAEASLAFVEWWLTNLRRVHGVGHRGQIDFWSDSNKASYKLLEDTRDKLYPIVHGKTFKESCDFAKAMIDEIMKEENASANNTERSS